MNDIGNGLGWLGFWLFLGMVFMTPNKVNVTVESNKQKQEIKPEEPSKVVESAKEFLDDFTKKD